MTTRKNTDIKKVLFLMSPYRLIFAVVIVSLVIFSVMEGVCIALTYTVLNQAVENIGSATALSNSRVSSILPWLAARAGIKDVFTLSCILLIAGFFIKAVFSFISQFSGFYFSSMIKRDLHNKIFSKFLNEEYPFFFKHKHGWLIHKAITVPRECSAFFDFIPRIIVNALRIIVILATLFIVSPSVTIFIMFLAVLYYFVTKMTGRRVSYTFGKEKVLESQKQNEIASEAFTGIKQLKIFMFIDAWIGRFKASVVRYSMLDIKEAAWLIMPPVTIEFVVVASLLTILMIAKLHYTENFASILPVMAIFGYAIQRIIPCFNALGVEIASFFGLLPIMETTYDVLSDSAAIPDGSVELKNFDHRISFNSVSFAYPGRDTLFDELSFDIDKGKVLAIVGPSGSGKSTVADLIARLLRPSKGAIVIDGVDINKIKISSWLDKIGLVTQDSFIFHGTVKENIALGFKDIDSERVISAAKEANAHDFIGEFPQGYETIVGDRGVKLSGGQRQRIAIARAIFRRPEILILDEATNSLDSISEAAVQKAIDNSAKGRTVIIIAHKISSIINADKIIVLKDGKISEEGRHNELIKKNGVYHNLYNMSAGTN